MNRFVLFLLCLTLIIPSAAVAMDPGVFPADTVLTSVAIDGATNRSVDRLKKDPRIQNWLEIRDELFLFHRDEEMPVLAFRSSRVERRSFQATDGPVMLAIRRGADDPLEAIQEHLTILVQNGAYTVFQAPSAILEKLEAEKSNHFELTPLPRNLQLLIDGDVVTAGTRKAGVSLPADKEKLKTSLQKLVDFKTRQTYTPQYVESAKHMVAAFQALGYDAELQEYSDYSGKQYNVVAQAKNFTAGKFFILGAHLDSTSQKPREDAPGADDNGSGSVGALEVARLLAGKPAAAKVRFVLFAGEEVGLKGSTAYVKQLQADNEISRVAGAIIFDMIGFDRTAPISCLFEMKPYCDDFAAPFMEVAKGHGLKTSVSHHPWGSDHVPFFRVNIPCFLFIEDEFEANPNYHKTTDLVKDVNFDLTAAFCTTVAEVLAEK